MTKDDSPPPREPSRAGGPPDLPGDGPAPNDGARPPRPPHRRRFGRALAWTAGVVLLIVVLLAGALAGAVLTERGTKLAWRVAVAVLGGRLSGTLDGGALATGVRLRNVVWAPPGGKSTEVRIDRVTSRWALTRAPLRFTVDTLRAGTIDVTVAPAPPGTTPATLPRNLNLPLQLVLRDLRFDTLRIHEAGAITELSNLVFHGASDGRHHMVSLDRLDTPFGALSANARLDGVRPFAIDGAATYAGKVSNEQVDARARLSGSLEALAVDLDASGMKLAGRAHIEAAPFGAVPLTRATLAFDHVNPRALAPGAPLADLTVRAELAPAGGAAAAPASAASPVSAASMAAASGVVAVNPAVNPAASGSAATAAARAASGASAPASTAAAHAAPPAFVVAGTVSVVNAAPGLLADGKLPLVDIHTHVRLDAREQRLDGFVLRTLRDGSVTGGGALASNHGRFDLTAANLDPTLFSNAVRPMRLGGPIMVALDAGSQHATVDLTDPKLALGLSADVTTDANATTIRRARVSAGKGRVDLSGVLKRDKAASYDLKATLVNFNPLAFSTLNPGAPAAARGKPAAGGKKTANGAKTATGTNPPKAQAAAPVRRVAGAARPVEASVNGTLAATGALAPTLTAKLRFQLGESVYDGVPMTGQGTLQLAGMRLLPSTAELSVAGNQVSLNGSFGAAGDRLRFAVDAPRLDRLGFGLQGLVAAHGELTGSLAHPNVDADYQATSVVVGSNRIGSAEGHAQIRDGANGVLALSVDANDLALGSISLETLSAKLAGTRAKHTLEASALGSADGRVINLHLAAAGGLTEAAGGSRWDGTVSELVNRGTPAVSLDAPLPVSAGAGHVVLGASRLTIEGAVLALRGFALDHGTLRTAGTLTNLSVARALQVREFLTGARAPVRTDLVLDGDWDLTLAGTASGHLQIRRRAGDVTVEAGRGIASLGITELSARAEFGAGNRLDTTLHAKASRIGTADATIGVPFALRDGVLGVADDGPLSGNVDVDIPALRTTGGLLGPSYLFDGRAALKLSVSGTPAKPDLSGTLSGDKLSATMVDQGVQLKDGIVRIRLTDNLVEFQQVEFHGAEGTLRALGRVRLDGDAPDLTASIVADKLELFASPDRKLSLSGNASVQNDGPRGQLAINGKFTVDRALFDLPESSAPQLSDDVVIVRPDGTVPGETKTASGVPKAIAEKPAPALGPRANIDIDLGDHFRFQGHGADLGLRGTITVMSAPGLPLRAVGNVRVTEGSTYSTFGRKLAIENGFFTFNGPIANPGINILAMRRNQEVEAGVQVTGTVQSPIAKLVSEPNVTDNEKLSWLLFGHGTDQGNNLGQQNTMTTALALLGSASGKRIAQTVGLDEFTIGRSDVGLTDPQVVQLSKAINERFVLGYEQGLQSASNAFKMTINLSRFWAVSAYGGTFQGIDLNYTRRFDKWWWERSK
ncbi:translocation/assembly module TamB domain-containing protein [Burkholderia plantarii]|uniref:translocation/assembly module TamB domain-containing protein n=1 Tax=Burkholderia plantarii TaxID=41899 RepID=UPI0018DC6011|nr:translocation/assembly module TamB domain-containing protein [Burkholderia plantarii]MBI0327602.1 translocation/assembly module TamB domain-containing protein [Burkholderia plantarii]